MTITKIPTLLEAYRGNVPFIQGRTIFCTVHGSRAYWLNTETSDVDIKGVYVAPREVYLGFSTGFEQAEQREPYDLVIYELRKFFRLAAAANPNIIEVLFTDPSLVIHSTPLGQRLLDHREEFVSMKVKHTFSGYAHAQLARLQGHFRWLKNPPKAQPTREDFGLPRETVIPADQLGAVQTQIQKKIESFDFDWGILEEADRIHLKGCISSFLAEMELTADDVWIRTGRSLGMSENFLELLKKERQYKSKLDDWRSYQRWLTDRNPERAALEAKFGYDGKFALHLVRLIRMCKEILTTGEVKVKRTEDREELLAIRNDGIWSYEKLVDWATTQDKELSEIYNAQKKAHERGEPTVLPYKPNMEKLDKLCVEIIGEML